MTIRNIYREGYEWARAIKNVHRELEKSKNPRFKQVANSYLLSKDEKEAIDEFYIKNYGKKIPYIYHQYFSAHSGVFDVRYFPNHLLRSYFEHYINMNRHYAFVFEDKNVLPFIAKCADVKMPMTILSKTCGILRDGENKVIDEKRAIEILISSGEVFCKSSTGSYGGRGCFVNDFNNTKESTIEILNGLGTDFVIQERIKCHGSIACIYPNAVNTFRIITYRWKDKFYQMPVFMRVGQGGAVVDNGAAGGMFLGVYTDGTVTDKAVTPYNTCILQHPDTNYVFKNHKIIGFSSICKAAIKMHQMIPQIGMVYWDFTIDSEGYPILIECNIFNGTIYAVQMTLGVPAFGERTAEVLQWIQKMKHTSYDKRGVYAFGY